MYTARNKQLRVVTQVTQQQLSTLTSAGTEPTWHGYGHQPSDDSNDNLVQRKSTSNASVESVQKDTFVKQFWVTKNREKSVHTQLTKKE